VISHVIDVNPAYAVRGPKYVVRKGKTSVLTTEEARELLDSIPLVRNTGGAQEPGGILEAITGGVARSRAHRRHGVQLCAYQRCARDEGAGLFVQGRRGWVRLHEKGGKEHQVPCHHNLELYLDEYIAGAGIAGDKDGLLFRTAAGKTGELTSNPMWQQDAYRMIQRRAADAGIKTRIGNYTFRATGITAYLKNKGTLEAAQHIANHESPRTTKLYDRRQDEISLDEVEKISI
jgi:integrase/recombinase XerD